jgi:pilus assembly protein CpaE
VTQIGVLTTDDRLIEMLRVSGLKVERIDAIDFANYSRSDDAPAAVVIDIRARHHLPAGLAELSHRHPGTSMVLVMDTLDPRVMLDAMRAGVKECLAEPLTAQAVDEAVRRVLIGSIDAHPSGQLYAFVGAKGGVGTSTLAANTAVSLARVDEGATLLIDLHLVHGDAALFLGAEPRFSVLDALENAHRVDESFFSGLVEKTKAGVHLLASSTRPLHPSMDPARTRSLLEFATRKYRYTVLDVPRTDFSALDALDPATMILVITSQEVSALRSAAHTAETLRQRYGAKRVKVVVNRFDKNSVVGAADIERVVGEPVKHLIPSDYRVAVEAVNTGKPIVFDKDGRLSKAIRLFAKDLAGIGAAAKAEDAGGVLARLAWRRA